MKIDFSDIEFNMDEDIELTEAQLLEYVQKTTLDAQRDLILATPIRDGTARRGWVSTTPSKPYEEGVIENNVEYISSLNDGSSKQAPANFVENVVERYNQTGGE
ncbi:HK97 gp10 family phage protein [Sphingobium limneticum]|uniref:HK97 gp10 family phage protein n=1 Tax=Sphingobium limneticum TaxID=1007511 RepID=A0A5J5I912_9SPHN|nr:HK97 gp10 family phage protein [Sphingobium limneticum]KAA9018298.1 hypothetical protein F4U96_09305 [Sphingobium limneticum]KAA9030934.1 hypothetical protein F4U95_09255 [Sphingobium limneticum]